tara:strand:- start:417 stop:731 length:315 start_codon:yes stop_codon:yes gene_type:complete
MQTKIINFILLAILFFLNACSGLSETAQILRNEKVQTTDEFLIKKNEPLSQPPDFEKLIEPGTIKKNKNSEDKDIKKILNVDNKSNQKSGSSSSEDSILKKITK